MDNEIVIIMDSKSQNEAFSRMAVSAFMMQFDPSVTDMTDVKTAVSEAVTNAIIHGYGASPGKVTLTCQSSGREIYIEVKDDGVGITDVAEAMAPLYTSKPELERSGMGFTVMETFMDEVKVESSVGLGTRVRMKKILSQK